MTEGLARAAGIVAAAMILATTGAWAKTPYPVKTVTLITHSSPGGGSDVFLRTLARHLAPRLSVSFAIENVRGGSSARAVSRVAQAPADGSVFYATTPTYIQTTILSRTPHGYDSLMPVVNVFFDPEVLYTRAASPLRSLAQAVAHAKANPGKVRWGASNPASLERIAMERLKRVSGAKVAVVSHEGGGDQMIGVLNGTYELGIGELQELQSQLESKQVRLLAVLTAERAPALPALPTAREQGIDVVVTKFRGLAGPKKLPAGVLKAWEDGIRAVLADPAYRAQYTKDGLIPAPMGSEEAGAFTARFAAEVRTSLRELGVVR